MSPDPRPDTMPGVTDFEATIPFVRDLSTSGPQQHTEMRVRIPAGNPSAAMGIASMIAAHISDANDPNDGPAWKAIQDDISLEDVDDQPSPADLTAEVEHWRRVVTALVDRLPLMTTVKPEEYEAADPSRLAAVNTGNGVMFTTVPALAVFVSDAPTMAPREPIGLNDFLPSGMVDPDVAKIQVHGLPSYACGTVDVVYGREWMNLAGLTVNPDLSLTVQLEPVEAGPVREHTFTDLVTPLVVRPAASRAAAVDLIGAAQLRQQLLTDTGWWTVSQTRHAELPIGYRVTLVRTDSTGITETLTTTYKDSEQVLLRAQPPGWWSK